MALYHKHRPQTFSDVVDQEHIIQTLTNQVKMDKVAHAYLFNGPRGVGKTTTARILAKALNCENRKKESSEPCNTCTSCTEISTSRSIDVIEIDAASHTGVDNVRQNIIENAQFKPTKSPYKVFIIDEVHMLSTAAFNALLKTLEEPPSYIVFILATTDPQKLPATIISRCQRFTFGKVSTDEMKKYLKDIAKKEGVKIDDEVLMRVVMKSEGCARDAMSLLDQLMAVDSNHITAQSASLVLPTTDIEQHLTFVNALLDNDQAAALSTIDTMRNDGTSMPHFMTDFILFLRTLLLASVDESRAIKEADIAKEHAKRMHDVLSKTSQKDIIALIDLAMKRGSEIKTAPLPDLPIEMLAIEWTSDTRHETRNTNHEAEKKTPKVEDLDKQKDPEPIATTETTNNTIPTAVGTQPDGFAIEQLQQLEPSVVPEETPEVQIEDQQAKQPSSSSISQATVEAKWAECITAIEQDMMSLSFIFKTGEIKSVVDNIITLAVGFSFHQERLSDIIIKPKLEAIISDILGSKIQLNVIIDPDKASDSKPAVSSELTDLAAAFGGEVM